MSKIVPIVKVSVTGICCIDVVVLDRLVFCTIESGGDTPVFWTVFPNLFLNKVSVYVHNS